MKPIRLSRNKFFLGLLAVMLLPFLANRIIWLAGSREAKGIMSFVGHGDLGSALGISTYAVIDFKTGDNNVSFHSAMEPGLKEGDTVTVLYQISDPSDAVVKGFVNIWMRSISYLIMPVAVFLILYLMPDRYDPVFPKRCMIELGGKPFFRILNPE
jgi:hypothetical protein